MSIQEELMQEASRCINCKHQPCVSACPAHNHIPEILSMVKIGALKEGRALWHHSHQSRRPYSHKNRLG